ncbi:hypothetical protein COTS27_01018 [Spirochaetota bacterium]|nr:hypothetical protein COTS27_01018 [Spirochaetota bacterium]
MKSLPKLTLKMRQIHFNLKDRLGKGKSAYKFALVVLYTMTIFLIGCTTSNTSDNMETSPPVPPPVASPLEVGDITTTLSGGENSPYAAATVTIEGSVIVISGITNLADATAETLTLSIADRDDPAAYAVEPPSTIIPATVLNPDGTNAVTNRLEGVQFVLTPVAAGSEAITYSIEVRLAEFVAPPVLLPVFAVEDITITPSGGDTSPYAAATPTIEGDTIIISGITNRDDTLRSETLTVSIADRDSPADYTAEPSSVTIPANVLNPDGINGMSVAVPNVAFVLTPVAAGGTAVTFNVELRLDALAPPPPLEVADITIAAGSHPAYSAAMVSSITGNVITLSGIKNKENRFSADLMLTISSSYRVTERGSAITGADNAITLAGASLNPSGVASTTTAMNDESLSFAVTSAGGQESASEKYYVRLMLGDLIQLKLLGGDAGDLATELLLSEGTSSSTVIAIKNCGMFPPPYEVFIGGTKSTTAYTLTVMSDPAVNSYAMGTYMNVSLVLSEGSTERATFPSLSVTTSACTEVDFEGTGVDGDPYIIDNNRRLDLVAQLVHTASMNSDGDSYSSAHYKVTRRIDLGVTGAPWSEGSGFTRIGRPVFGVIFQGTFDCDNNEIANLYINRGTSSNVGLFGYVSNATIQNCVLTAVNVRGKNYVGGLVGRAENSTISRSHVTGTLSGVVFVGGLVGGNNNSMISNSYMIGTITGDSYVGGLVGLNGSNSMVSDSYANVTVTANNTTLSAAGGLIGLNDNATINSSYATGTITGMGNVVGGLIGRSEDISVISNSYAAISVTGKDHIGGLVGVNDNTTINFSYAIGNVTGTGSTNVGLFIGRNAIGGVTNYTGVTNSYYNRNAILTTNSGDRSMEKGVGSDTDGDSSRTTSRLTGLSETELKGNTAITGWDSNIWQFAPNGQYPRLKTVVCANRQYSQSATGCAGL